MVDIKERIQNEIEANDIMLFMKGTPEQPQCGFSAQVVQILNSYGAKYGSFDVLSDFDVREGIKEFSNWPTIPQLYVKGKFVGGCDIAMQLHRSGEMAKVLGSVAN